MKNLILKVLFLTFAMTCGTVGVAQETLAMSEAETVRELSMSASRGETSGGLYRYYAKGENTPFTGILYAKYPNGNYASRQEFIDGIGQGKWINYYENGNYKEIGYYNKNLVEGPITKYHENGTVRAEGTYKDWRVKIGKWKYYDRNGVLVSTVDYGKKGSIEEVKEYYERGDIPYSWYSNILTKNGFDLSQTRSGRSN